MTHPQLAGFVRDVVDPLLGVANQDGGGQGHATLKSVISVISYSLNVASVQYWNNLDVLYNKTNLRRTILSID